MKYSDVYMAISQVLKASGLSLFPVDVVIDKKPPFGNVSVINSTPGVNYGSISGVVIIDIYVVGGKGAAEANDFADSLDEYLVKKSHQGAQFFQSSFVPRAPDKGNPGLTKYEYTVRFKFFGT